MGRRKKGKKHMDQGEDESLKNAPHSFVINRGSLGPYGKELMFDMRRVLEPFTAVNLKVRKKNVVKDFVSVAGLLHVTHILIFTRTRKGMYLRFCRLPRGPTLVFKIKDFSLSKDIVSSLRKPVIFPGIHMFSPLLVMNSFPTDQSNLPAQMIASMFRNLFQSINLQTVKLNKIRRVVLINYDEQTIDFRHYSIQTKPVGLSKPVKKLISSKKMPNLGNLKSMDELFEKDLSESEGEGLDEVETYRQVTVSQPISSRGNLLNEKCAIRLTELGPRMTLKLIKIQEGLLSGQVLYHAFVDKKEKHFENKELDERDRLDEIKA